MVAPRGKQEAISDAFRADDSVPSDSRSFAILAASRRREVGRSPSIHPPRDPTSNATIGNIPAISA